MSFIRHRSFPLACATLALLAGIAQAAFGAPKLNGKLVYFASQEMRLSALDLRSRTSRTLPVEGHQPALSPDGKTVAYIDGHDRLNLYRLDTGKKLSFAAPRADYTSPTFVSDDLIAYLRDDRDGWRIYLSPTDRVEEHAWEGQTPENLIGSVTITAVPGSQGEVPAFILAGRPGLLYLSVAAPRLVLRCTREGDIFRYPAVSPDGKKIAFARDIPEGIWVVNSNGTGLRQLDKGGSWPAWSPDGKYLAFLTTALVTRGLSVVDQAGIEKQRTAGSFLMSIGIMSQDGKLAMPLLNSSRKSLHTRGDNVAWR